MLALLGVRCVLGQRFETRPTTAALTGIHGPGLPGRSLRTARGWNVRGRCTAGRRSARAQRWARARRERHHAAVARRVSQHRAGPARRRRRLGRGAAAGRLVHAVRQRLHAAGAVHGAGRRAEGARRRARSQRRSPIPRCAPRSWAARRSGPDDAACLGDFIRRFGRRALRRPLDDAEVQAYQRFQSFATASGDFYTAVSMVARAMLQDMEFVYRVELGTPIAGQPGVFRLGDFETASRLVVPAVGPEPGRRVARPRRRRRSCARMPACAPPPSACSTTSAASAASSASMRCGWATTRCRTRPS